MRNMVGDNFYIQIIKTGQVRNPRCHLGGLLGGVFDCGELVVIVGTSGAFWRSEGASSRVIVARRMAFLKRLPMLPVDPLWLPVRLRPM